MLYYKDMTLKNKSDSKYAFTLAEILVTLVIIGVVAALTIPTLINNLEQKQLIVAWRKAYSDVARALLLVKIDGASLEKTGSEKVCTPIANQLSKHMNAKVCSPELINYKTYILRKPYTTSWGSFSDCAECRVLENGVILGFDGIIIMFDVNGPKKPNTYGKDIFFVNVDKNNYKINPAKGYHNGYGAADGEILSLDKGDGTCGEADEGRGCSAWYLLHDK